MKLKKKVIFGMIAGLFAVATVFNMSILNENGAGDVSLDDIAVMAQAQLGENPGDETKYIVSMCSCSKGTGDSYTICNFKTTCTPHELGSTSSCTSSSCLSGCGC